MARSSSNSEIEQGSSLATTSFGDVTHSLIPLAGGVYAWVADEPAPSVTNSGIVLAQDGVTVVDAGVSPLSASPLADAIEELTTLPIKRLVLTGSHIDLVGGAAAFPLAGIYGSGQTSDHLDQPPNPDAWKRMHPGVSGEFDELPQRPVSHVVAEAAHLCPASIAVPAGGPQFENLVVQVPSANVVFVGCVATFGSVPLGFEADVPAWIAALDTIATYGEIFVPSHGPLGGVEELIELRSYLEACVAAKGSLDSLANGPWMSWQNQQFHEINIERAHMLAQGDPSPPPAMLRYLGLLPDL